MNKFQWQLLFPNYWLTWFGLGLLWLIVKLPYRTQLLLGKQLGRLMFHVAKSRRRIAAINLELCLPELNQSEREQLLRRNMESLGIGFFETGIAWWWPKRRLKKLVSIEGMEHLENLNGQGALLLSMHFTTLEIGASLLSMDVLTDGVYRPHRNRVFDYVQRKGRGRHMADMVLFPRNDVRGMVRALRKGRIIWFAPDQDMGKRHSVFSPWFGKQAATVTSGARLAELGKAAVLPFTQTRLDDGSGYKLIIYPPLTDFPSGDDLQDAVRVNQCAEEMIRQQPEQYLWVHRRFKTRPEGEASPYLNK